MEKQELRKTIYDDSSFLSSLEENYDEIFDVILPSMKINVDLLEKFYSCEFKFNDKTSSELLMILLKLCAGRLNEFIFYLVKENYDFKDEHRDILTIVKEISPIRKRSENTTDLFDVVDLGYMNLFKYLIKTKYKRILDSEMTILITINYSCHYGYLHVVKNIINSKIADSIINVSAQHVFEAAIIGGSLDIAKYAIELESTHGKINIHIEDEKLFDYSVSRRNVHILEYLISLEPTHGEIDLHIDKDKIFNTALIYPEDSPTIEFLLSLEPTHGRFKNEYVDQWCLDMYVYCNSNNADDFLDDVRNGFFKTHCLR